MKKAKAKVAQEVKVSKNAKKAKETIKAFVEEKEVKLTATQVREAELATMQVAWNGLKSVMRYRGLKHSRQPWVLTTIVSQGSVTAQEIADSLSITIERAIRICRALEDHGLIERDPADAAFKIATFTLAAGLNKKDALATYEAKIAANQGKGLKSISEEVQEEVGEEQEMLVLG